MFDLTHGGSPVQQFDSSSIHLAHHQLIWRIGLIHQVDLTHPFDPSS
jgi:hypothetical protein